MTAINLNNNASYNFKAPLIEKDSDKKIEVVFPTAESQAAAAAAVIAATVERFATVIVVGDLEENATLNLTIGDDVPVGALLLVRVGNDATHAFSLTPGTGLSGNVIMGEKGVDKSQLYLFDGESFVATTAKEVLDGVKLTPEVGATTAVAVANQKTIVDLGTLTGATTVNLTIGANVPVGATLTLIAKSDTTARDVTPGTGFTGPVLAGVISKTKAQSYIYDGEKFIAMGAAVQLD